MTIISADNRFEWDSEKNDINIKKHGLSFEEILPLFDDPFLLERYDSLHSSATEDRFFSIGSVNGIAVVSTVYTERQRLRIISARLASPFEEKVYYEYCKRLNR
ncbi:MAG: BrnT family toxin [Spirochaetales bacterium]|nr:BrnT family toxin [Spirochaetales bacterium]